MKSIVLKLSTKGNRRILFTVVGIAICITYLTGTIGMVEGLNAGTSRLANRVKQGPFMVYKNSMNDSFIDDVLVEKLTGNFTAYKVVEVNVRANNTTIMTTYAFSLYEISYNKSIREALMDEAANITDQDSIWGTSFINVLKAANITLVPAYNITLSSIETETNVSYAGSYGKNNVFPNDWVLVSGKKMVELKPSLKNGYSFLMVPENDTKDLELLRSSGFETAQTASFLEFFEYGIYQIEGDLWGIIATSAIIITILVYSIMSIEVQYRLDDIRILRFIGASRGLVMLVFVLQSFLVAMFGGALGVSLGVMSMNAITSFAPLIGYNTIVIPQTSWQSIALPFFVALAFGVLGGLIPAYKASKLDIKRGDASAS